MAKSAPSGRPTTLKEARSRSSHLNPANGFSGPFGKTFEIHSERDRIEFQTDLRSRLLETFSDPDFRAPVLPSVAVELIQLSRRANVCLDEIVKILEKDQVLAAEVLRLAQSAAYSTKLDVRSIQGAVSRIGLSRAADLFLRAALESKLFRITGYGGTLEKLRQHSIATAEVGRIICRYTRGDENYAYMCGLLHDVGIAGAIIAITNNLGLIRAIDFSLLWPVLSSVHQQFTIQLAALWGLPQDLRTILRHHHTLAVESKPEIMASVTVLAEILAAKLGFNFEGEESLSMYDRTIENLGLSAAKLEMIEHEATEFLVRGAAPVSGRLPTR